MKRYRLTESRLRNMIREVIQTALNEGKAKDTFNKAVKYGKKQLNKFNQSIKDLTDEYDEDGNPIVDNPMYKDKKSNNESRLRNMIREAVINVLNEVDDDTIRAAADEAEKQIKTMKMYSPYYDNPDRDFPKFDKLLNKRERQLNLFKSKFS